MVFASNLRIEPAPCKVCGKDRPLNFKGCKRSECPYTPKEIATK